MVSWFWLTAALAGWSYAAPQHVEHVLHEARAAGSGHMKKRGRVETGSILPVRIALTQSGLDKIDDMLKELSHPKSPKYGKWMSTEDVHNFFAPAEETVNAVKEWLRSAGIASERIAHSGNKGWIAVDATAEEAEMLFATTYHEYEHPDSGDISIGTDSYSIPQHLVPHIDYVKPGVKFVPVKKRLVNGKKRNSRRALGQIQRVAVPEPKTHSARGVSDPELAGCYVNYTASCARAMYGLPALPLAVECNELGIFEEGWFWDQADLDMSYHSFASWVPNGTHPIELDIDGAVNNATQETDEGLLQEAMLDVVVATSIVYPQKVIVYQVNDPIYANQSLNIDVIGTFNTFLDAIDGSYCNFSAYGETGNDPIDPKYPNPDPAGYQGQLMCGVYKPTKVISLSVIENEIWQPPYYQKRQCLEWAKLGLMGTSVLAATGDAGVGTPPFATSHTWTRCNGPDGTIFDPQGPANCPYVTAVGATRLYHGQTVDTPESVMSFIFPNNFHNLTSGTGWSNLFPQPDYQKEAVEGYFAKYDPGYPSYSEFEPDFSKVKGFYNRIGRAYPDVSAYGFQWPLYIGGDFAAVSGTSVSAPLLSGIITLLNQERALIGKDSVGFLNHVFYSHPEIFNDIVNGTVLGCGIDGFPAVPGWDPSSGMGTPRYEKMKDLWLSLP